MAALLGSFAQAAGINPDQLKGAVKEVVMQEVTKVPAVAGAVEAASKVQGMAGQLTDVPGTMQAVQGQIVEKVRTETAKTVQDTLAQQGITVSGPGLGAPKGEEGANNGGTNNGATNNGGTNNGGEVLGNGTGSYANNNMSGDPTALESNNSGGEYTNNSGGEYTNNSGGEYTNNSGGEEMEGGGRVGRLVYSCVSPRRHGRPCRRTAKKISKKGIRNMASRRSTRRASRRNRRSTRRNRRTQRR